MRETPPQPRRLGTVGLALLVGVLGGAIYAVRDSMRVVFLDPSTARDVGYLYMLRFGLTCLATYVAIGMACMLPIGVGAALLRRSEEASLARRHRASFFAAALALMLLSVTLLAQHDLLPTALWLKRYAALIEVGVLALCAAVGLGVLLERARARTGRGRVFAAAIAVVLAFFLVVNWGLWLYLKIVPQLGSRGRWAAYGSVVAAAVLLGVGTYRLLAPCPAGHRALWRRGLGLLLAAAAVVMSVGAHVVLLSRIEQDSSAALAEWTGHKRNRPNILLVVMDTVRADALSCYGARGKVTPHLDALAAEGTLYERALAASSWTLPSHASLFTGLLPSAHGTSAEHQWLEDRFATLAETLSAHGYWTFGYTNNPAAGSRSNLHQGFREFRTVRWGRTWRRELLASHFHASLRQWDHGAHETHATVRRWMDASVARERPFFVFINYMEAHAPYGVTPKWHDWFPEDARVDQVHRSSQDIISYNVGAISIDAAEFGKVQTLYHSDVAYLDDRIGDLIEHLRTLGVLDETLVILTSDHGEHFGDHELFGHRFSLYNSLIHVPLIVRYPPAFEAGKREPAVVSLLDLVPTILDVMGIEWEAAPPLAGRSLLEPLPTRYAAGELAKPLHVLPEMIELRYAYNAAPRLRRLKCIQSAEAKYIWASDGRHELYDLRTDPEEQNNLIAERPEQAAALKAELEARIGHPLAAPSPGPAVSQPDPRP